MSNLELVLEYLRVLLAGAPIAGVLVLVFLAMFRKDLRALIGRIATIRFAGGELSITQAERTTEAATTEKVALPPQPQPDPSSLPADLNLTPEAQERLVQFVENERARAALWEYRFLNLFLVPHTQVVLDWLIKVGQRTTVQMYDSVWMPLIRDPKERRAILDALRTHHLIDLQGQLIHVTPKGEEYAKWRGPLPYPQAPPNPPAATSRASRGR